MFDLTDLSHAFIPLPASQTMTVRIPVIACLDMAEERETHSSRHCEGRTPRGNPGLARVRSGLLRSARNDER